MSSSVQQDEGGRNVRRRFRRAYAEQRAAEGRGAGGTAELLTLPYLQSGPLARPWRVRARTFDRLLKLIGTDAATSLRVLDLGAGNGWLCYRLARLGHRATALDIRDDAVDGLGAARAYANHLSAMFPRVCATFEQLPLRSDAFDLVVFNASIHYAQRLENVLAEAARVARPGGRVAILDSPFYATAQAGDAMVAEKHAHARDRFGARADDLLAMPAVEYLTRTSLERASAGLPLTWRRHAVRYPLWYEARPLIAALRRRRTPSRFDLWEATVA